MWGLRINQLNKTKCILNVDLLNFLKFFTHNICGAQIWFWRALVQHSLMISLLKRPWFNSPVNCQIVFEEGNYLTMLDTSPPGPDVGTPELNGLRLSLSKCNSTQGRHKKTQKHSSNRLCSKAMMQSTRANPLLKGQQKN